MHAIRHLAIVGPGRLGRSLAQLAEPTPLDVSLTRDPSAIPNDAEAVLLTVPDGAIETVARQCPTNRPLLHSSGATDLEALGPHPLPGSFHPLMTFPGPDVGIPDVTNVPVALAGCDDALAVGRQLASLLGMHAFEVHGDRRLYHAAAVMAGNFATVLLAEAAGILDRADIGEELPGPLLAPLALQSLKFAMQDPRRALTGPAARGDHEVIEMHRAALASHELSGALDLYDALLARTRALVNENDREGT